MNRFALGITASIALIALGCGDTSGAVDGGGSDRGTGAGDDLVPPSEVSIQIRETVIRPWNLNDAPWDGLGIISPEDIQALDDILGLSDPYLECFAYLAELASRGWGLPDPRGYAELFADGEWSPDTRLLGGEGASLQNTCVSPWNVGWDHVPLEEATKVHIALHENDLLHDDPIGDVEINYRDLLDAVRANQVFYAQVSDQGQGAILFVGISVTAQ